MKAKAPGALKDGTYCTVIAGTHAGKSGVVRDIKTSATGHVTITVVQANGVRFKTLARSVVVEAPPARRPTPAKKTLTKKSAPLEGRTPAMMIDARIKELGDWRGELLGRLRGVVMGADPAVIEEWKWNVPVWSRDGIICTGETYKSVVKLTFAKGAALKDPAGLFNSSLEGNTRRAIDFREGEKLNEKALKTLVRAATALNKSGAKG